MSKISFSLALPAILVLLLVPFASSAQNESPTVAGSAASAPPARDWSTFGYDQERSGWNRGEITLAKSNVSKLKLLWSTQLSTPPRDVVLSTLTAPLVVEGVNTAQGAKNLIFVHGADDTIFALDANTGKVFWQKSFTNSITPERPATWTCSNTPQATPVIDKQRGIVFFITNDGKLRAHNLSDGTERMTPTDMVPPFARAWSLNLIDNVIYTQNGRGCGNAAGHLPAAGPATSPPPPPAAIASGTRAGRAGRGGGGAAGPVPSGTVTAMDVNDLAHPEVTRFYTGKSRPGGPWGRGGVARTPNGVITTTADGLYDPAASVYGESVLELAPKATQLVDSFIPSNWRYLNAHDLDFASASPIVFPYQNQTLVAVACKEGVVTLLDAANLGGGPPTHSTPLYRSPQLGNDAALGTQPGQGVWGAMASYETPSGKRFLYVPMWGPPSKLAPTFIYSYGAIPDGSIMAFQVTTEGGKITMTPAWTSPNLIVPDAPVVANGVVYATQTGEQTLQANRNLPAGVMADPSGNTATYRSTPVSNLVLYALDAETGKVLYSSKKIIPNWTHFNEPVVALGKVFVVTHDAHVYAFGLGR